MCVSCSPLTIVALSVSEASEGGYTSSWNVGEGLTFTCSINDAAPVPCEFYLGVGTGGGHIRTTEMYMSVEETIQ